MSNGQTKLDATHPNGHSLSISHTRTDSPVLPAANLQQLQQIDPSLVTWVVKQTETEADHRRHQTSTVNWFAFIERILSILAGAGVALAGLGIAAYLALQGHDIVAGIIGGSTLVAIVTVIIKGRPQPLIERPEPKQNKKRK